MIPMRPAPVAAGFGQSSGAVKSPALAIAAVFVALVAPSLTFVIHSVRRRSLSAEMLVVLKAGAA